ncbi:MULTISPECIES: FliH/SctL family protein [unclassified Rubrivivax]|uniref:FliH/SctL family protein n=1 Tax=unclassified Rubrivivax TaxID=2649762 RepID=UPI0013E98885|nr:MULTISPECIES: FliH/SctL family protein [unclassified Rubrivivax]MCC9596176.1 flagellar biosynthesis protein [Rubrivivax sp. JA1055]MCC9647483.1 flagellar biosynthesis protein [Rubrivivax sp. JA1029]MCD0418426.1 flagellar biosynthesis protein [Rubrivivax sp. JA1024]
MSSSSKHGFRNVPPPQGSKPASAYTRFIPREELGDFAAWKPGSFHGEPEPEAPPPEPAAPPEPTPEEWLAKIAAARQAGYQDGYRDGLVALEGFKQSFASQATAQVGAVVDSFNAQFDRLDAEIATAVARTAVQLARQVLRSELQADPSLVARVAAEAVNNVLLSARHITVRVHPNDLPLVAEGAEEALTARGARLLADDGIERGGVLVDSDVGSIDARIASRWAQAAAAMGSDEPWEPTP